MIPLELALGFGIGLSLGLLGGGGSLLTVPALVYLVGQTPQAAVTRSLVIVGTNSMVGTFGGMRLSRRLSSLELQKAFAVFVTVLAVFLLIDNFPKLV